MSTLRVSNIEAKADVSSPTVDEKIKFTNSSGDVLFHLDGKTSGITTVGINTTGNTFTVNNTTGDISFSGSVTSSGVSTFTSDVSIADKIVHIGDTDTAIRFPAADTITAETGGSERLRIDSSGNVSIGVNSTDTTTLRLLPTNTDTVQRALHIGYNGTMSSGTHGSYISFGNSTPSTLQLARIASYYEGGTYSGSLRFYTNSNSDGASPTERLRITHDGNLALGDTIRGAYPIDLQSTSSPLTLNLKLNKDSTTGDYAEIAFQLWSGAGTGVNTFGGSGTSRPSVVLRAINESTNTAAGAFVVGNFIGGDNNNTLYERFRITSSGNVGIGTDNPTTEFEVLGAGTVASFRGTGGNSFIGIKDEDDGTLGFIGVDGGSIKFQTSGSSYSDKLVIDAAGHVTKPGQPCFAAWRTTTQSISVGDILVFNSERFDNNSDYNTSTGEFTAPVTGRYLMLATVLIQQADVGDQFDIRLYTSNQTYYGAPGRTEVQLGTSWTDGVGNNYIALGVQHIVDMDANDVASIRFTTFDGGSIYGTGAGDWTRFAGYLLC